MLQGMYEKFESLFDVKAEVGAFAPGRINLIGEHTDYNGGYVFPAAIELGTYGLASQRTDRTICLYSNNFEDIGIVSFTLDELVYNDQHDWANYPKGVVKYLNEQFDNIDHGFNILIEGNIPNGASLSSSASIELLTGWLIKRLFNLELERLQLIKLGQVVENKFMGVNSGIMDQFIIGMGKAEHALLLDTATLDFEYVPAKFGDYVISIMNTNKRRSLTESKYNERRSECEMALSQLQQKLEVDSLGELSLTEFDTYKSLISDDVIRRRAKHAISENERTKLAHKALTENDFEQFGELLNASHKSLKDDYEVTGIELDTLAETAQQVDGVLGARMTGAGFAGCAIALVDKQRIQRLEDEVSKAYIEKIGYAPSFYHVGISDGVKSL
ncbi:galactokinase [Staphylococcus edaphicus]|uniref:Galactokinase n=1 Tax=Staphylococcus edaphicus TaxID=1955013 RepID=A0A2C6WQ86_9STAP|nr:galactokinase [Staphylococcus edaphicus]PHK50245.1 galactokinase [Staphylococcus edaphicus]UQW82157.1 galactokinase [Staphylococcus edaphicus]